MDLAGAGMELPSVTSDDATRLGFTLKRSSRSITLALVSPGFSDHSTLITRFSLSISVTLAEWIRPLIFYVFLRKRKYEILGNKFTQKSILKGFRCKMSL